MAQPTEPGPVLADEGILSTGPMCHSCKRRLRSLIPVPLLTEKGKTHYLCVGCYGRLARGPSLADVERAIAHARTH